MPSQKGFLLIDIAYSLVIIGIMSMFATIWYLQLVNCQAHARSQLEALSLASQVVEKLRSNNRCNSDIDLAHNVTEPSQRDKFSVGIHRYPAHGYVYTIVKVGWLEKKCHHQVELVALLE